MPVTRSDVLSEAAIARALAKLPGWTFEAGKLHREYHFADFVAAFSFMAGAALVAQAMDHHPEWSNVWNKVEIILSTHDAGGLTKRDVELARRIDGFAAT